MKKRILSLVLCLIMALSLLPTVVFAEETAVTTVLSGSCGDNVTYVLDSVGTLTISGTGAIENGAFWLSESNIKTVVIKDGVTSIGDSAFEGCESLTSVTIPDSVTSIGNWAFSCTSLTNVTIPDGITSIGDCAFFECTSLTSITIPDSVTSIGDDAFYWCTSLTSITIPDSVTSIGDDAFYYCISLTSITIPDSVTSIGDSAFSCCESLTSVTIPDSVTSIGDGAFYWCTSLKVVHVTDITKWCSILFDDYNANPLCSGADLYIDGELATEITIPDGVTSIGSYAFYNCASLTSIIIPNSVMHIGNDAFSGCKSLTIKCDSDSYAETYAKNNSIAYDMITTVLSGPCGTNVTYVLDNEGMLTITGTGAMKNYSYSDSVPWYSKRSDIKTVVLENGVTSIGSSAFSNCESLTSITIPDSVTSIGSTAFDGCTSLTMYGSVGSYAEKYASDNSIKFVAYGEGTCGVGVKWVLKDGILTISGSGAMKNYLSSSYVPWKLSQVKEAVIEPGVTSIGNYAFSYCTSLTSVTIPDSVTRIGSHAFYDCESLTSITIPDSVTSIGNWAFSCTSLTNVTIPDGITSIGDYTFYYCESLTSVIIPVSITSIGNYAFYDCESLTSIIIPDNVTSIGNNAFYYCKSLTSIMIPDNVTSIGNNAFSGCASLVSVIVDENNANYCAEDGVLFDKAKKNLIIYPCKRKGTSYTIPNSVTSIGSYAFYYCKSLTSVTIPDSVTSIGNYAFYYCESLTSITIPDNVTSIGDSAFYHCESLTSVTIPDSVTSIENSAFSWCESLTSITIPDSVTSIGDSAFSGCSSLTSITIPESVTSIGDYAFNYCSLFTICGYAGSYAETYAKNNSIAFEVIQVPVTGISLDKKTLSLYTGESATLTATIAPSNATNINVFWSSTNETAVTVSNGTLSANAVGTAIITARTEDGNKVATCMVTVKNPISVTSLTLNKTEAYLIPRETVSLTATVLPSDATYKNVLWKSSDESVAKVSEDGMVTAQGTGSAIITATTEKGEASAECSVTVQSSYEATAIALDKSVLDIKSGNSEKLNVIFNPEYTADKTVTWLSLDEGIATVDENGVVKGIGEGSTTIIVMSNSGSKSASCIVNVTEPITYSFGQSVQIGLIEPWFLKANLLVYTESMSNPIDYDTLKDYGAYFIRKSELEDESATQNTLTVEDILNNPNAVKKSKLSGTAGIDGSLLTANYDKGLYTYEMGDSIFVLFYVEDKAGIQYAPIRERNIKSLLDERKNNTQSYTNVLERNVYDKMSVLEENVKKYRAQFDEVTKLPDMNAPMLSKHVSQNGAFTDETVKTYTFGNSVQLVLVEPWGLKVNAIVKKNGTLIDYNSFEEYGAIVFYDTSGEITSGKMSAEELRTKSDAYVFSSKAGDATIDGSLITALYNKGIYTYQINSNAYVMFYVKDADGYHYGDVKVRNAYELAKTRGADTSGSYGELEKVVYQDMVTMYETVKAYRDDYFNKN